MRVPGPASWRISVDRWSEEFDLVLWFRAAERIDVSAGESDRYTVPGPLDVESPPEPSTTTGTATELAAGWLAWWRALVEAPRLAPPFDPTHPPRQLAFHPPEFAGLIPWPSLRNAVLARWAEAHAWHNARKRAGLEAGLHRDMRTNQVVSAIERELGRKAEPFDLEFVLLPVSDDRYWQIGPHRYLVPERLYDGTQWPRLLRTLVSPLA